MKEMRNFLLKAVLLGLTGMVFLAGCARFEKQRNPAPVPEIRPGILQGYLLVEALPDSLALLPPPPADLVDIDLHLISKKKLEPLMMNGVPRHQEGL